MEKNAIKKKSAGFTLIELIVSMAIILTLLMLAIFNYGAARDQLALERAAYRLAKDIRDIENSAMGAKENSFCKTNNLAKWAYGYGINYISGSLSDYILFADCDDNSQFAAGSDSPEPAGTIEIKGGELQVFYIKKNGVYTSVPNGTAVNVVFTPPDPFISLKVGNDANNIGVKFTITKGGKAKSVIINKVGLIDIQ